jgi:ferrous iron transport protein B
MTQQLPVVETDESAGDEKRSPAARTRIGTVALVGQPNCGKSTLFNRLTGLRQKIANYPGVTVEYRVGQLLRDRNISLIDLPGIRCLEPHSEDEQVAWKVLRGDMPGVEKPDAVFLILDGTNLGAQLALTAPILALGKPTLILVNLADALHNGGGSLDVQQLQASLGAPVALISAKKGTNLRKIYEFLSEKRLHSVPTLPPILQQSRESRRWARKVVERAKYRVPRESVWSQRLDSFFLHPVWGPLFLLGAMVFVFQGVFGIGQLLANDVDHSLRFVAERVSPEIANPILKSLVIDGLWKGVGSVLVFLPPILLLFLFLGVLEDSGYLARAAVISDRTMAYIGLNGKAFIPLLAGYGCAVPAIMATRVVGSRRDRFATMFVIPFMTCSARLPVYTLLIAAFIPSRSVLWGLIGLQACTLLSLYALGFLAAVVTAKLLNSTILEKSKVPFLLELPEYRLPSLKSLALLLVERARIFLTQVGTVVLAVSLTIWLLIHLPIHHGHMAPIEDSILAHVGHRIEPVLHPLGFNWKIGMGLVTSFVAREAMVGTLGTIYGAEPTANSSGLASVLRQDLTPPNAIALLVFFALAMQCTSTFAAMRRETNSWKWPLFQFAYMSSLAYVAAWMTNHLLSLWL